jgi:Raf kinase inhibitor-like YbhB/YbcL family protein
MRIPIIGLLILAAPAAAVANNPKKTARLDVTSPSFENNEAIPVEYTCEGAQVAPPLSWSKVPKGTRSIAILVDDPEATNGTFTHWLVTNIPPTTSSTSTNGLPQQALESNNGKGEKGYTGPCPPSGTHHYHFQVFALDRTLPETMSRGDFMNAIAGHTLASGKLVGTYTKQPGR